LNEAQIRILINYILVEEKNPRANALLKPSADPSEFE
jgi:hypothetical protein